MIDSVLYKKVMYLCHKYMFVGEDYYDLAQRMFQRILEDEKRGKIHTADSKPWSVYDVMTARRQLLQDEKRSRKDEILFLHTGDVMPTATQQFSPVQWREPSDVGVMVDEGWRPFLVDDFDDLG